MLVKNLRTRKQEPRKWSAQLTRVSSEFDPRPESLRPPNLNATEQSQCSLLALNKPCAFLCILVPDVKIVWHDHSYPRNLHQVESAPSVDISKEPNTTPTYTAPVLDINIIVTLENLQVSSDRCHIEEGTREQSSPKE